MQCDVQVIIVITVEAKPLGINVQAPNSETNELFKKYMLLDIGSNQGVYVSGKSGKYNDFNVKKAGNFVICLIK